MPLFCRVASGYKDGGNWVCCLERRKHCRERTDTDAAAREKGVDFPTLPGVGERAHRCKGALRWNAGLVNSRLRDAAADQVVGGSARTDGEPLDPALRPDAVGVVVGDDAEKWSV